MPSKLIAAARGELRRRFYHFLGSALNTDDGRRIVTGVAPFRPAAHMDWLAQELVANQPYSELGRPDDRPRPSDRDDTIIITARFRSGSTLLWQLFRQAEGCTAYYEPLNERRWFDRAARGDRVDATHLNVSEYWREYEGLEVLGRHYKEDWIRRDLLMDEDAWDPELKAYVDTLIDRALGRPVLQFNRIDFRLPWFRRHYPHAKYVHIYRHPRDQWCSTLMGDAKWLPRNATIADFPPLDHFYLGMWAEDLKYQFPFLDVGASEHPYRLFYYIWKLSYLFGRRHCDHSVRFESLIADPTATVDELFTAVNANPLCRDDVSRIVASPSLGKWRSYAEPSWFEEHESHCEEVLRDFLRPRSPLPTPEAEDREAVPVEFGEGRGTH